MRPARVMVMGPVMMLSLMILSLTAEGTTVVTYTKVANMDSRLLGGAQQGAASSGSLLGTALGECTDATAKGWKWDEKGTKQITSGGGLKLCLEATSAASSVQPTLQPCDAKASLQQWVVAGGSVALASSPHYQWVSNAGDTKPDGAEVWLYDVGGRQGYCASHKSCSFTFDPGAGTFKNPAGSCVVTAAAGPAPPPHKPPGPHPPPSPHKPPQKNLAYTCVPGSAEAKLPFCDISLGFDARSEDLVNRLTVAEQIDMFFSYPATPYIERFNIKSMNLDSTCIHGLASRRAGHVTVFPHAIAQGASWDPELIRRMSNVTAVEARISSAMSFQSSGTDQGVDLSCDGGPLANSAHDQRWGRISETYGEDPMHIQTMGVSAMHGLQSPHPVAGGKPEDVFFATRQVKLDTYKLSLPGRSIHIHMHPCSLGSAFGLQCRSTGGQRVLAYSVDLQGDKGFC